MKSRLWSGAWPRRREETLSDERPRVASAVSPPLSPMTAVRDLPTPALRWVGAAGRIALRTFDFAADNAAICEFQRETYSLNFPDFRWNDSFANAFRHDLRRASLDGHHGIFVLDSGRDQTPRLVGFLWIVVCENSWTRERFGYINNISVLASRRGQGLGRALMAHSEDWLQTKGVRRARLTVTATNEAARHLYEECGFRVTRLEMDKDI